MLFEKCATNFAAMIRLAFLETSLKSAFTAKNAVLSGTLWGTALASGLPA